MSKRVEASVNPPWYVNVEFDIGRPGRLPLLTGTAIDPETVRLPAGGNTEKSRKRLPDLIVRWEIVLVSQDFRDAIETLEPSVHQFFPFKLRNGKRGAPTERPYYILSITQMVTSMDLEKTSVTAWRKNTQKASLAVSSEFADQRFVLNAKDHEGLHLWRETYDGHAFYMSETLYSLCQKRKLRGLEVKHQFEDL